MVTTKANGLEIAVGDGSGVVYRRSGTSKMPSPDKLMVTGH